MANIIHIRIPDTVVGLGAISKIADVVRSFAPGKILIITDMGLVKAGVINSITSTLEKAGLKFDVFDDCKEKPPMSFIEKLSQKVREENYDLLIGVGGGSSIDTAKVVSIVAHSGMTVREYISTAFHGKIEGKILPKILVPTTAGTGSEWGSVAVVYDDEPGKPDHVIHAMENFADKIIIDPELTLSVPQKLTADTGIDALTHSIEAYTCFNSNFFSDMSASTAIKLIADNVRLAYAKGRQNIDARYNLAVAASLAQVAMETGGVGIIHLGMCGALVAKAHISHGTSLAILLPAAMQFNLPACPAKFAKIAELMGENISGMPLMDAAFKSIVAVSKLTRDLGMPQRMSEVGITEKDIPEMARMADEGNRYVIALVNPRDATADDIARIYKAAL